MAMMQQMKPKPEMAGSDQVLLQTSMAETQRRAQRDQAEVSIQQAKVQADIQQKMAKMQMDQQIAMEDLQLRLAIATGDNETQERIETARLTRDAAKLTLDHQGQSNGYE
jgi:glycine cleavage system regulatory protein